MSTTLVSPVTNTAKPTASSEHASGLGSNKTLVIVLAAVLSALAILFLLGTALVCLKYQKRRLLCFSRGVSPIDDDEIATWKTPAGEKTSLVAAAAGTPNSQVSAGHARLASTNSVKKPPSVIIYPNRHSQQNPRRSGESSPGSLHCNEAQGKTSFEKELPKTPVQAIAPNARAGLTDETIPGDDPFLPSPKRRSSRLSKAPLASSARRARAHARTRSSRSSTRSFGDFAGQPGSDVELSPRASQENSITPRRNHSRVYSSPSVPPRLSVGEKGTAEDPPPRTLLRGYEIGRAVG